MLLRHSLSSRVIELVLSSPRETALDSTVSPQSLDDVGQIFWQDALLLCCCRQGEQLASIILNREKTHRHTV